MGVMTLVLCWGSRFMGPFGSSVQVMTQGAMETNITSDDFPIC